MQKSRQTISLHGVRVFSAALALAVLAACGQAGREAVYPEDTDAATAETGSVFDIFTGGGKTASEAASQAESEAAPAKGDKQTPRGLAVNADLWRATLETISFMPLASADPNAGVVITEWYNDPKIADERFKINIIVSGVELRADAVRVTLMREKKRGARWSTVDGNKLVARQLENIILTRARDFRIRGAARR